MPPGSLDPRDHAPDDPRRRPRARRAPARERHRRARPLRLHPHRDGGGPAQLRRRAHRLVRRVRRPGRLRLGGRGSSRPARSRSTPTCIPSTTPRSATRCSPPWRRAASSSLQRPGTTTRCSTSAPTARTSAPAAGSPRRGFEIGHDVHADAHRPARPAGGAGAACRSRRTAVRRPGRRPAARSRHPREGVHRALRARPPDLREVPRAVPRARATTGRALDRRRRRHCRPAC